jgi:hypothetical protein
MSTLGGTRRITALTWASTFRPHLGQVDWIGLWEYLGDTRICRLQQPDPAFGGELLHLQVGEIPLVYSSHGCPNPGAGPDRS